MPREALLVLGMHRSGTSAVAGLLVRLGVRPPKTLMGADADNPEGYWESTPLCAFHERLLRAAGSRWDAAGRLDREWCEAQATTNLGHECRGLLQAEYGDASRFVLKDPRVCRFVPFWLRVLAIEGIAPRAVLVYRNPLGVARSLSARNGLDRSFSIMLWLRHVIAAESDTRTTRRTLVRYEDLLENWHVVAQTIERDLGTIWPARSFAEDAEIQRFVNPVLRHDVGGMNDTAIAPVLADWVKRTLSALDQLRTRDSAPTIAASDALDGVRQELDRATDSHESWLRALREQTDTLRAECDGLLAERDGMRAERDLLLAEHRRAQEASERLRAWATSLQHQIQDLDAHSSELRRAIVDAHQDAAALRASVSWRITAPLRAVGRIFG